MKKQERLENKKRKAIAMLNLLNEKEIEESQQPSTKKRKDRESSTSSDNSNDKAVVSQIGFKLHLDQIRQFKFLHCFPDS